jgi:hypothetical protein
VVLWAFLPRIIDAKCCVPLNIAGGEMEKIVKRSASSKDLSKSGEGRMYPDAVPRVLSSVFQCAEPNELKSPSNPPTLVLLLDFLRFSSSLP